MNMGNNPMIGDVNVSPVTVKADLNGDITPLIKSSAGLMSSSNKGVGKILNAMLGSWIAKCTRKALLIAAQADRDVLAVKSGEQSFDIETGELQNSNSGQQVPLLLSKIHELDDEVRFLKATIEASKELELTPEEDISDEPLSQDFFNRWRREVEIVEDEELRRWWSHLLTEEVKKPNTISVRTLDVVKNLSADEAKLFQKIARLSVNDCIPSDMSSASSGFVDDILIMKEAGLLGGEHGMRVCFNQNEVKYLSEVAELGRVVTMHLASPLYLLVNTSQKVAIPCYHLTRAGNELLRAAAIDITENEAKELAIRIMEQYNNGDYYLYKVNNSLRHRERIPKYDSSELTLLWDHKISSFSEIAAKKLNHQPK